MLDFLIMYEVKVRELESIILLGNELKYRGYQVDYLSFEYVNLNYYLSARHKLKKYFNNVRVVLMPSLYHNKELYNIVYYVCGRCEKIVNLRWEQYFTNKVMSDPTSYLFPHGEAKNAYHVCWGKTSYNSLVEAGVETKKLLLTGALQLDFLRKDFLDNYKYSEKMLQKYGISKNAKTILYISSFTNATMTDRQFIGGENSFDGVYKTDRKEVIFAKKSYELTLVWIEELVKQDKNIFFFYRPHPCENITERVEKLALQYNNFKIVSEYSVKQWILTCDIILTWISTSIVEAFFAEKACLIVRPIPFTSENDMPIYKDADFVTTKKDFINAIYHECRMSISADVIRRCYSTDGDTAAYIRLSNALEQIIQSNDVFEWNKEKMRSFDKKRGIYILKSVVASGYFLILKLMLLFQIRTKVKFGKFWNPRVENYRLQCVKNKYEKLNNKSFKIVEERIHNILENIRVNSK